MKLYITPKCKIPILLNDEFIDKFESLLMICNLLGYRIEDDASYDNVKDDTYVNYDFYEFSNLL